MSSNQKSNPIQKTNPKQLFEQPSPVDDPTPIGPVGQKFQNSLPSMEIEHDIGDISADFEGKETDIEMFIHGLNPKTKPKQLVSYLKKRCKFKDLIYKRIKNRKIHLYQSYAFFTVETKQMAAELIRKSGILKGRIVHCDVRYTSKEKMDAYQKRRLFLGNLDPSWTDKEIHEVVSKYGRIRAAYSIKNSKTGEPKGYGFADFFSEEDALSLLSIPEIKIKNTKIEIKEYQSAKNELPLKGDVPKFRRNSGGNQSGTESFSKRSSLKRETSPEKEDRSPGNQFESNPYQHRRVQNQRSVNENSSPLKSRHYHHHHELRNLHGVGGNFDHGQASQANQFERRRSEYPQMHQGFIHPQQQQSLRDQNYAQQRGQFFHRSLREENLRLIGLALRNENLFLVERFQKTINKILEIAPAVSRLNQTGTNYSFNLPDMTYEKYIQIYRKKAKRLRDSTFYRKYETPRSSPNYSNLSPSSDIPRATKRESDGRKKELSQGKLGPNTLKNRKRRQRKKKVTRLKRLQKMREREEMKKRGGAIGSNSVDRPTLPGNRRQRPDRGPMPDAARPDNNQFTSFGRGHQGFGYQIEQMQFHQLQGFDVSQRENERDLKNYNKFSKRPDNPY